MVSLIIPSFNPVLKLPDTLNSLVSQTGFIDELILVIDHNHYDSFPKELISKYQVIFNLVIIKQEDSGRAKSRNKGAEVSKGDLLIFLDDDMLVEDGLIEKHIRHHKNEGSLILTGNGYRNPKDANNDFGKFLVGMERPWREKVKDIKNVTLDNFTFTACNMSIPRKVFMELGGFDVKFPDGEDFDFAVRALLKSYVVKYDNSLIAWHNDWPVIDSFIRRQAEYTKAKKIIFEAHPEYIQHFSHMVPKTMTGMKKTVMKALKGPLLWFVNSGNVIFASLPANLKSVIYNYTIAFNTNSNND